MHVKGINKIKTQKHYHLKLLYKYVYCTSLKTYKTMIAANYTEFRTDLKKYLDEVEQNHETLIIKRGTGKGTVVISLEEYNSIMETVHLLSSRKNAERLFESIRQMNEGNTVEPNLKVE